MLSKQRYDEGNETVCVSEDINKIRTSLCEDFDEEKDYPIFEIWRDGENIYQASGNDVREAISKEMYNASFSLLMEAKNMLNEECKRDDLLISQRCSEAYWNECLSTKKSISSSNMDKLKEMCNGEE